MADKRHFSRIDFVTKALVSFNDKKCRVTIKNISLNGALFYYTRKLPFHLDDELRLTIVLTSSRIKLNFICKLIHHEKNNYGLKFKKVDIDTIIHLRRLLELNTGNPDKIIHELPFLIHREEVNNNINHTQ